jgi:hypothetical protein
MGESERTRPMAEDHVIQPGEHMVRIAAQAGFRTYKSIWDAAGNDDLKTTCPNPNILFAGKHVQIPDPTAKKVSDLPTGQEHTFTVTQDVLDLHLILKDENDKTLPGMDCDCPEDGTKVSSDGSGKVDALDIDRTEELGILKFTYKTIDLSARGTDPDPAAPPPPTPVNPDSDPDPPPDPAAKPVFPAGDFAVLRSFALGIGYLDPLDQVTGIQARLNNLGYYAGDIGYANDDPQALQLGIEEFEVDHKATITGDPTSSGMQGKLKTEHGC